MTKHILVTGGNSGIGFALCKLLVRDHSCHVYLGSRDLARGNAALKTILDEVPAERCDKIEVVQIDVGSNESCVAAAHGLKVTFLSLFHTHCFTAKLPVFLCQIYSVSQPKVLLVLGA